MLFMFASIQLQSRMMAYASSSLRRRLYSLETRVAIDAAEFRENIADLKSSINETCVLGQINNLDCDLNVPSEDLKTVYQQMTQTAERVQNGFHHEKLFIREYLTKLTGMVEQQMKSCVENNMNTFASIQSEIGSLEEKWTNKLLNIGKEVMEAMNSLEQIVQNNDDINDLKQEILLMKNEITENTARNGETNQLLRRLQWDSSFLRSEMDCLADGGIKYRKSCYILGKNKLSWSSAAESCKRMDGYLVEIDDGLEQEFVLSLIKKHGFIVALWLGASDIETEGTFVWAHSGIPIDDGYKQWSSGQPNNGRLENCLNVYHSLGFKWNDAPCGYLSMYLCEKQL